MTSASSVNSSVMQPKMRNKGFFRAQYAQSLIGLPASAASIGILGAMRKVSAISKEDAAQLTRAARKGLRDSGLYEKGVRIYKMNEVPFNTLKNPIGILNLMFKNDRKDKKALNAIGNELKSNKLLQRFLNSKLFEGSLIDKNELIKTQSKAQALMFKLGTNACYLPNANKIITPNKSLQTSVFHEMGHALNNNGGVILKSLQKMRGVAATIPATILLISLLNKRKTTDETNKNDSVIQKGADFVKRNAGKLTALAFLPMVAEEGIASLRGQGIAKNLVKDGSLTKELFKKVKLTNLGGFSSYVFAATIAVATTKFAIFVKDKIQARYEAKKMAKFEAKNNK